MMNPSTSAEGVRAGPTTERHRLDNGLVLRVTPARDLPYVVLVAAVPVGLSREEPGKAGLASVTLELMARGCAGLSRDEVAEAIDFRGANFSTRQGRDAATLELRVLRKDLAWALELIAGMLRRPTLEASEFAKVRKEAVGAALSREEEPRDRVLDLFGRTLMGDHPYGRHVDGTSQTLEALELADAVRFYRDNYGPSGAILCLAGDVDPDAALHSVQQHFGGWSGGVPAPGLEHPRGPSGPVLACESMPIEQAKVVLGFLSIARNDPDFYAVLVMNYIFGGAFRSRLTQNLRAARGLAYSVGSGFSAGMVRGSVRISIQTGNDQANLAVREILREVERIRAHPVSEKELTEARQALLGGYALRVDTLPKIASLSVETELYGLPEDHAEDFRQGLSSLSSEDVRRAARRLFVREGLAVAMVADLDKIDPEPVETLWPGEPVPDVAVGPTEGEAVDVEACVLTRPEAVDAGPAAPLPSPSPLERGSRVHQASLANGLKLLVVESHKAPVATVQVWYRVGSRNERPGLTGMSHFLEHMMFRGSPAYPDGRFDEVLSLNGGVNNAFTTEDFTAYYESMAARAVDFALELEVDRMRSLMFTPEAFYRERNVVVEERRLRVDDSPSGAMFEQMHATAFTAHPYQWPVIGWMSDVEAFEPGDLVDYYRRFYTPNNATLVVAGDVEPEAVVAKVSTLFGLLPRGEEPAAVRTREPVQNGQRRFVVHKKAGYGAVLMGYHTPCLRHPDSYALELLSMVLAGGESARLPTEIVSNQQRALSAWTYYDPVGADPGLFFVGAEFTPETDPGGVERAVLEQIERLRHSPVSARELQKVVNQWEADFVMRQDDVEELAVMVGAYDAVDSWRHLVEDADRMRAVTPDDLQRVTREYLTDRNCTTGTLIPRQ